MKKEKLKKIARAIKQKLIVGITLMTSVIFFAAPAFAVDTNFNPIQGMTSLMSFLLNLVTLVGVGGMIFGGVQLALSLKSQQAEQRTAAIIGLGGGAVLVGIRVVLQIMGVQI